MENRSSCKYMNLEMKKYLYLSYDDILNRGDTYIILDGVKDTIQVFYDKQKAKEIWFDYFDTGD